MPDEPTYDPRHETILAAIRETGASAPAHDSGALATVIGNFLDNGANTDATTVDEHASSGGTEADGADEHADDAADQATAADIAAGKVVEPAEGGRVQPADG